MALMVITGDCDLIKVKKGEECLAFICDRCQYAHIGKMTQIEEHPYLCQCCGHFGNGEMCVCTIGDWLSLKPLRVFRF